MSNKWMPAALVLAAVAVSLSCGGCLIGSDAKVTYGDKGPPPSDSLLGKIQAGTTGKAMLTALLGKPTRVEKVDDHAELAVYEYKKKEEAVFAVFIILGSHAVKETRTTLFFELTDGVVQKYWVDSK